MAEGGGGKTRGDGRPGSREAELQEDCPVKGSKGLGRHPEGREVLGGKSKWRLGVKMRSSQG